MPANRAPLHAYSGNEVYPNDLPEELPCQVTPVQMFPHTDHEQTGQIVLSGPNHSHLFLSFHTNVTCEAWDLPSKECYGRGRSCQSLWS